MVATLPRPVLNSDSIYPDTANAIAGLFSPDHSQLKRAECFQKQKAEYKEKDFYRYTRIVGSGTAGNKNHFFQRRCIFCLYRSGPRSKI